MTDSTNDALQAFCSEWTQGFSGVLGQLGAASVSASSAELATAQPLPSEASTTAVSCRFLCGGVLKGELLWFAEKSAALPLAQLLMSEPLDPAAEFTDARREAFAELLRQVAGQTATAWKQAVGADSVISFHSASEPPFLPEQETTLRLSADKLPELDLRLLLNAELCQSLRAAPAVSEPPSPQPASQAVPASSLPSMDENLAQANAALPSNLDLLLDVQLDATIRFGERSLPLREIFGLMPGAVVELDQMVNEPADLLVAGRLVARGEVVVVDGNFGLRITEVASKAQRAQLLPRL